MARHISRRTLLRAGGTTTLAALLAACGSGGDDGAGTGTTGTGDPTADDASAAAGGEQLTVIVPAYEVLTGADGRIPIGVLGADQRPILDADLDVTIVRDTGEQVDEGEVVAEGLTPTFYGEGLGDRGIYYLQPDLATTGRHGLVVSIAGRGAGTALFAAIDPADSTLYAPGQSFPTGLETPTADAPGPLETICTQDPQCSMHEASLGDAMAAGPVVLTIATPQFCQTAVCGPVVSVVDEVKAEVGRDDVTFVHLEVFTDAGNTYAPIVEQLTLPSEPWTWVLAADGTVADRFEGPVVPSLLRDAVQAL